MAIRIGSRVAVEGIVILEDHAEHGVKLGVFRLNLIVAISIFFEELTSNRTEAEHFRELTTYAQLIKSKTPVIVKIRVFMDPILVIASLREEYLSLVQLDCLWSKPTIG